MTNKFITYTGREIDIENFTEDDVCLEDIAHHLSNIQRFNGGLPTGISYSVGEHCINLYNCANKTNWVRPSMMGFAEDLLAFTLFHDASEAYISDIVSPVKAALPDYKNLEKYITEKIRIKLGICDGSFYRLTVIKANVEKMDKRIFLDEVETIIPERYEQYKKHTNVEKLGCHIMYNNHPSTVERCFLTLAKRLMG